MCDVVGIARTVVSIYLESKAQPTLERTPLPASPNEEDLGGREGEGQWGGTMLLKVDWYTSAM